MFDTLLSYFCRLHRFQALFRIYLTTVILTNSKTVPNTHHKRPSPPVATNYASWRLVTNINIHWISASHYIEGNYPSQCQKRHHFALMQKQLLSNCQHVHRSTLHRNVTRQCCKTALNRMAATHPNLCCICFIFLMFMKQSYFGPMGKEKYGLPNLPLSPQTPSSSFLLDTYTVPFESVKWICLHHSLWQCTQRSNHLECSTPPSCHIWFLFVVLWTMNTE